MNAAKRTPKTPTDWAAMGRNVGIFFLNLMAVFALYQQSHVVTTVEKIKHQTDGNLLAAKHAVAISARSLFKATGDPKDEAIAKKEEDAYTAQLEVQEKAETQQ